MMVPLSNPILKGAAVIGVSSLIALGLVGGIDGLTAARIAANERQALLSALNELIPPGSDDDDVLAEPSSLTDEQLSSEQPLPLYRARRNGVIVVVAFAAAAPEGYSGEIRLLVAVRADGTLVGVRVISHKETPGLGDPIDTDKSDWILGFNGRSLQNPAEPRWAVKKDGGDFDQFSGATITPRAVVAAVKQVLVYVRDHQRDLFAVSKG